MPYRSLGIRGTSEPERPVERGGEHSGPRVHVCIDLHKESQRAINAARLVAHALGADITLTHVIEPAENATDLPDPVEWELRRQGIERRLRDVAKSLETEKVDASVRVMEGRSAEQICRMLADHPEDIAVLYRSGDEEDCRLGMAAQQILEHGSSTLLIVPETSRHETSARFSRIFLLLDGSEPSEMAIPMALRLAGADDAELLLVHATPEPALTRPGPSEPRDDTLLDELRRRNRRVAEDYLDQQGARLKSSGVRTRPLILTGGDVRRRLTASAEEEHADLIILASHGQSGFSDVAVGDVAGFVIRHTSVPVLLVRSVQAEGARHVYGGVRAKGARPPDKAVQ